MARTGGTPDTLQSVFILALLVVTVGAFLGMIRDFLVALVLAAVFAGLLHPVYVRLRDGLGGRSVLAACTTLLGALLAIGLPIAGLVGLVVVEAVQVSEQVGPWVRDLLAQDITLADQLPEWMPYASALEPYEENVLQKLAEAASSAGSWLVSSVSAVTQGTLGFLLGFFVMLYAMFYFLLDGPHLLREVGAHLPLAESDRELVLERGLAVTKASLKGLLVIGLIQGVLVGLGLWVCGLSGAAFWGTITFVLSAVPGLGAPIVWLPAAVYLMLAGELGWGIALALWGGVVVGLVDNLLRPQIVGRDAKLPDLVVLVSVLGGIGVFGALGLILGPILASLVDTALEVYRRTFAPSLPD